MAAEFVAAATAGTIGNLATEYASPYLSYFFQFGKIVEDFKNCRNELELKRHRVRNDVDEALRQTEVIEKDVEDWLTRTEKALGEAQNLEAELERNKCFSWCPSWGWRYRLSKRVAKKTLCISQLSKTCNFQRVGHRAILPDLEFIPSKDFMSSESSNSAFKEIMDALNKGDVNMIGLYGMGGVGKTTLAKEVGKQAKQIFDKVVIVTVSQAPNVNNIQDKIADFLDLVFEKRTIEGKAEQLWLRIKEVKNILIILDDVWEELDLKAIGIPFGDDHNGCKIFLTTRLKQVCTRMNCQKDVQLNILSEHEAWALLKNNAGLKDVSSPLNDVAKKVAGECKGLPLSIVTVGRALKDETLDGWKVVYQRLKDSRHIENQDVCGGIYSSLKISYDYLKTDSSRSCLLLCSLFPEDHEIRIEELTMHGIGQGMFDGVNLIEDARSEMRVTITNLQKSGLLLNASDERLVKMHDAVRDFVHWMTSEGENTFMVKSGLKEWPRSESFRCCTTISLMKSQINIFPDKLEFPNLKTLLLDYEYNYDNESLTRLPSIFFEGMKTLNVLVLRNVFLSLEGLQFLTNLRTLYLEHCRLENASALGNLKKLEILVIRFSDIRMLPYELWELTTLRLLAVWNYSLVLLPPNLQPRMKRLEELHLHPDMEWRITSTSKLCSSPCLTSLSLWVSSKLIPKSFVFPPLQSFLIIVNSKPPIVYGEHGTSRRILEVSGFSLNAFTKLFWNVEELTLNKIKDYKNIVPSADQAGLNEHVEDCKDLEYLIDTTQEQGPNSAMFSNLVKLTLTNMICLKELCHGRGSIGFLQKLEKLTIGHCDDLIVAVPCLQNLKQVRVQRCKGLQVVFQIDGLLHANEENQTSLLSSLTSLELNSLPELKYIWKGPPHLVKIQSLEVIRIGHCDKLTSLFSASIAQSLVHLEELKIYRCSELENIITEAETNDSEIVSNTHLHPLCWPKLRTLDISNCPKLRYVFPTFVSECLPRLEVLCLKDLAQLKQVFSPAKERDGNDILLKLLALQEISVKNCPQLTCFIVQDQIKELSLSKLGNSSQLRISSNCSQDYIAVGNHEEVFQVQGEYSFSSLNVLHLEDLSEVRIIWRDVPQVVTLENLTALNVIDCKRLSYIFSPTAARGLSQLVCLNIQKCDNLDRIIAEDQVCSSSNADLQPISFPNLTTISVGFCKILKSLFPLGSARCLPKLEKLIVERNSKLEQVFELEDEAEVIIEKEIKFDQLEELSLQELPGLIDFCPSGYHFVLPDLKCLTVAICPKMTTCFFIDSEYSVHAKTETPRLVEQDITERTATTQNTVHTENIFWYGQEGVLPPYMEES